VARPIGDVSGRYVVLMDLGVDCRLGPSFSPRGVITLATVMTIVLTRLRTEMKEMRYPDLVEAAESVRRRVGQERSGYSE
jgi:hypothetical protein